MKLTKAQYGMTTSSDVQLYTPFAEIPALVNKMIDRTQFFH